MDPEEDRQTGCTIMLRASGNFRYFSAMDTFSGWVDALPTRTKTAAQVAKVLQIETIPRLGLPGSLQINDNSTFLPPALSNKRDKKCPGHKWPLHSAWVPQLLRKGERLNQTLKGTLVKLRQETQGNQIVTSNCPALHVVSSKR